MSLTTYQSKFVLVGGRHPSSLERTNLVLTSTTGLQWEPSLPTMPTKRSRPCSVSTRSPEVLVVAGGEDSHGEKLAVVEVLVGGDKWITIDPLPEPGAGMTSTLHEGNLYFMTMNETPNTITTCSCATLIPSGTDSCSSTSTDRPLWRQFQAPDGRQSIVSYYSRLVSIENQGSTRGYSSITQSWMETSIAGNKPDVNKSDTAATVLPTGEILYCRHRYGGVYKGTILGE